MRKALITLASAICFAAGNADLAYAQTAAEVNSTLDDLFGEHAAYEQFFEKLKKAITADAKETVAALIEYPFETSIKGKKVKIKDPKHFVSSYDQIITPKVKSAVAKQTYATLFANSDGVMIGDGEVWFSGVCSDDACNEQTVSVTAINN